MASRVSALRKWLERWLVPVLCVQLVAGLLLSIGVVVTFAELSEKVVEGETRRFDEAVLLWIEASLPAWLDEPMRAVTALGYYWVVLSLLAVAVCAFYVKGLKLSAALLLVSTTGGIVLTTVLKAAFGRDRPDLFETGYAATFYSFPSGHATVAVGFYGALALLIAWRLSGGWRWAVAAAGALLVFLIGFSRLYLGVHYPTDVVAGYLSAPLWVSAVGSAYFLYHLRGGLRGRPDKRHPGNPQRTAGRMSGRSRKGT